MDQGFTFQVIETDPDYLKLRISAWNGLFGGSAEVYVAIFTLDEVASILSGFPDCPSDTREATFGSFGPGTAGGAVNMRFYCADKSGHAWVESRIESEYTKTGSAQSVVMACPIEAASLDLFLGEIRRLERDEASTAHLRVMV
jgi:hypothetical protein